MVFDLFRVELIQNSDCVQSIQIKMAHFYYEKKRKRKREKNSVTLFAKAQCHLHFILNLRLKSLSINGATNFTSVVGTQGHAYNEADQAIKNDRIIWCCCCCSIRASI